MYRFVGCFRLGFELPRVVGRVSGFVIDGDADVVFGIGLQSGDGVRKRVLAESIPRPIRCVRPREEKCVTQVVRCGHLVGCGRPRDVQRRLGRSDGELLTVGEVRRLSVGHDFLLGLDDRIEGLTPVAHLIDGIYLEFILCVLRK